jgi:protein-tyrosine phosphatase
MELTRLPFSFPGDVYRSAMPYSSYDPRGDLVQEYKRKDVALVVMLTSDQESLRVTGYDLRSKYETDGFEVLYLPIPDFSVPEIEELDKAVTDVLNHVRKGDSVAIHCHAGIGRTGMFLACLAKRGMGYSSDEALRWVREFIPGAVEVSEQEQLVRALGVE